MFVWNERWKWFFVDRKKDGNGREGVGDKKWQRIENRWEMKYIRTPGARSRGYDLSWHTVVPHWARGSKWGGERAARQTGEEEGKQESLRKTKEGRGARQTQNFSWEKPPYIQQKYHPTQILCSSIRARAAPPWGVDTKFADVHTTGSGTKGTLTSSAAKKLKGPDQQAWFHTDRPLEPPPPTSHWEQDQITSVYSYLTPNTQPVKELLLPSLGIYVILLVDATFF